MTEKLLTISEKFKSLEMNRKMTESYLLTISRDFKSLKINEKEKNEFISR